MGKAANSSKSQNLVFKVFEHVWQVFEHVWQVFDSVDHFKYWLIVWQTLYLKIR